MVGNISTASYRLAVILSEAKDLKSYVAIELEIPRSARDDIPATTCRVHP